MSVKNLAKVVWRWKALPQQVVDDFRHHKRIQGLPTSLLRRFIEQERLLWSNRIRASDYYSLGLFDESMPVSAKRGYIGGYETWRLFFAINPEEHHSLTDEKLRFNALAKQAGLPVSEVLAVVTNSGGFDGIPTLGSKEELRAWMIENDIADIVVKPVDGIKGWGILSLGARLPGQEAWAKPPRDETIGVEEVWQHCSRYLYRGGVIVERRLRPHPVLAEVMPDVLHTVRVVTHLKPEPFIVATVLRVGSGKGPADNLAQGGIMVPVNAVNGHCGRGTMLVDGLPRFVDDHPVTGTRMTGMVLPDWRQVRDLALAAARTFDMQKSIGWDIGLTTRGPVLLEGNWCYDLGVNQIAGRQGVLDTPWLEVFNREGAFRRLSLGFSNRQRKKG